MCKIRLSFSLLAFYFLLFKKKQYIFEVELILSGSLFHNFTPEGKKGLEKILLWLLQNCK